LCCGDPYTERELDALKRILAANTSFEGWGGYSVRELVVAACRYKADCSFEQEEFLTGLQRQTPASLRYGDIKELVWICLNVAGVLMEPFKPDLERELEAA
jgi:hypothetical protein